MSGYTNQFPSARPVGTRPMVGTYNGAELAVPPARPTATSTREIPTRMGARLHYKDGRITDLNGQPIAAQPPAPAPMPAPAAAQAIKAPPKAPRQGHQARKAAAPDAPPATAKALAKAKRLQPRPAVYTPHTGSIPAQVLAQLQAMPNPRTAYIGQGDILHTYNCPVKNWIGQFGKSIAAGLLQRVTIDGKQALALPAFSPVTLARMRLADDGFAIAPHPTPTPTPARLPVAQTTEVNAALAELAESAERAGHVLVQAFTQLNEIMREASARIKSIRPATEPSHPTGSPQ